MFKKGFHIILCFMFLTLVSCTKDQTVTIISSEPLQPTEISTIPSDPTVVTSEPSRPTLIDDVTFYLTAQKNEKYGVINQDGDEILAFNYHFLSQVTEDGVMMHQSKDEMYEIIDINGEVLHSGFEYLYPMIDRSVEGELFAKVSAFYGYKDDIYWLIDSKGDVFSTSETFTYHHVSNDFVTCSRYQVQLSSISKELIESYQYVRQTKENVYFVINEDTFTIYDDKGDLIISYDDVTSSVFLDIAMINHEGRSYIINEFGHVIFDETGIIDYHVDYESNLIIIMKEHQKGLYRRDGYELLEMKYDDILLIRDDFYIAQLGQDFEIYYKNHLINTVENLTASLPYHHMGDDEIYLLLHNDNLIYYYQGNQVLSQGYIEASLFNDSGYAVVKLTDHQSAIINRDFEIVHQEFSYYRPAINYFIVKNDEDLMGVINHEGEVILPIQYDQVFQLESFFYTISNYIEYGFSHLVDFYMLNQQEELIPINDLSFDVIRLFDDNASRYFFGNLIYFYNQYHTFEAIEDVIYVVEFIHEDYIIAYCNHKFGAINASGEVIIPFIYDRMSSYIY